MGAQRYGRFQWNLREMLTYTSISKAQIFKKFEKVKVWKFSHLKKSAITFAQGCTRAMEMVYAKHNISSYLH